MKQNRSTVSTANLCLGVLKRLDGGETWKQVISALESGRYLDLVKIESPLLAFQDGRETDLNEESMRTFIVDYFAYNLLRKFPFKGLDRKGAALSTFRGAEETCRMTNTRLMLDYRFPNPARDAILALREKIGRVLGRFDWDVAQRNFAWGPGATTRLKNSEGDVYFKFRGKPETTLFNLPLAVAAVGMIPHWFGALQPLKQEDMFTVVPGSKVTTVPKDAKTDRTIAIEPCMNMYIQKGIGAMIRDRLRRVGVDLNDQSRNQDLAAVAHFRGLATIDLSAASDSVSAELIELVLPDDWLMALKRCRSSKYVLSSEIKHFEKFSTMGNGYTFELESLIFWAITSYVVESLKLRDRTVGIYGDDIICHKSAVPDLIKWLKYFGFTTNVHKSFWSGPFFESCGKHYFGVCEVTPVYVDEPVVQPHRLTWFANSFLRWSMRTNLARACDGMEAWKYIVEQVPEDWRLPIPDGVGDGGLLYPDRLQPKLHSYPIESKELPSFVRDLRSAAELHRLRPRRGKSLSTAYQRGFDFTHWVESDSFDGSKYDPTDVPYLLRSLYRLEKRSPSALGIVDGMSNSVYKPPRRWRKTRGWTSSWPEIVA